VVGSDPKVSQDLDRYLDPGEFKLLISPHGKSLITSLTNAKPDLVILDLNLTDQSGTEAVRKIRELDSNLPLIVLSKNPAYRERAKTERNFAVVTPSVQMEKLACMVKEILLSKPIAEKGKVLLGSVRFSSRKKGAIQVKGQPQEAPKQDAHSDNQDYQHVFEQMLTPIFGRIIKDCRGHIYDRLLSGLEKTMISEVLKFVNHNQVRASQLLGISRNTLRERMKRFDIY
jgi:DNA-binding NtrC family response regulator